MCTATIINVLMSCWYKFGTVLILSCIEWIWCTNVIYFVARKTAVFMFSGANWVKYSSNTAHCFVQEGFFFFFFFLQEFSTGLVLTVWIEWSTAVKLSVVCRRRRKKWRQPSSTATGWQPRRSMPASCSAGRSLRSARNSWRTSMIWGSVMLIYSSFLLLFLCVASFYWLQ